MRWRFYLRYAQRSLVRGGQRSLLALLCVAFGVLSLVSMLLLSGAVRDAVVVDPRLVLGGDVGLSPGGGRILGAPRRAELTSLRTDGLLGDYTLLAQSSATMLRPETTGQVFFLSRALGVDPATYPLVGTVRMREPAGASFAEVVTRPGDVAITRDLARKLALHTGDQLTLTGQPGAPPTHLRVAGVIEQLPDRQGATMLYSLQTARLIAGGGDPVTGAAALWGPRGGGEQRLRALGWRLRLPADVAAARHRVERPFSFLLRGAGLLGLLLGGLAMANTLQVVLARRTPELATLKSLGYQRRDLLVLLSTEAALLGVAGAVVGVAASLLVADRLMTLLDHLEGSIMLSHTMDVRYVWGGLVSGVVTALLFGLHAALRASGVRPAVLFRQLKVRAGLADRWFSAALYGMLVLAFGSLAGVVLGSLAQGLALVVAGLAGLFVLGALLWLLLLAVARPRVAILPLVGMAQRNLRHRPLRSVFALIALFSGVFAIGLASAALVTGERRVSAHEGSLEGYNLTVYGTATDATTIRQTVQALGPQALHLGYPVAVQARGPTGIALPTAGLLEGRSAEDATWDLQTAAGTAPLPAGTVLAPAALAEEPWNLHTGDTLRIQSPTTAAALRVAGFYRPRTDQGTPPTRALIATDTAALRLGGTGMALVAHISFPADRLAAAAQVLGTRLPAALVISKQAINDFLARAYHSLFAFVIGIAGLALLAGTVLIANAVGLAMVERKRELGILKAVGYSSSRVLLAVLIENGLLGLLGGLAGMAAARLAMVVIRSARPDITLQLDAGSTVALLGACVALALLAALAVAWKPTRVRPLAVLRDE